jgi:hypothetical protein
MVEANIDFVAGRQKKERKKRNEVEKGREKIAEA